jgi:hypothetical protein
MRRHLHFFAAVLVQCLRNHQQIVAFHHSVLAYEAYPQSPQQTEPRRDSLDVEQEHFLTYHIHLVLYAIATHHRPFSMGNSSKLPQLAFDRAVEGLNKIEEALLHRHLISVTLQKPHRLIGKSITSKAPPRCHKDVLPKPLCILLRGPWSLLVTP